MARVLLVGAEPTSASALAALLPGTTRVVSDESVEARELVIADVGRVDPPELADSHYPDVVGLGFRSGVDAAGLRHSEGAGSDLAIVKTALLQRAAELIGELLRPVG